VASLEQCFQTEGHEKPYEGPMPSHEQFFFQLVTGLQYIHEKGLVHGSIKPSNILIRSSQDPQIKLSEFGFTLPRWNNDNSAFSDSGFMSDKYWLAPELHHAFTAVDRKDFTTVFIPTRESDVFASGKVFFYYYAKYYSNINSNCFLASELIENETFSKFSYKV
jgi:serine/threonine protein kinase